MLDNYDCNYSEFDLTKHKETYPHYLEVIIDEDGKVHYAHPSHQEKLIKIAGEKSHKTRQQLYDECPDAFMFDVVSWLCSITNCISVWAEGYLGTPNIHQAATLVDLHAAGVYEGKRPEFIFEALSIKGTSVRGKVHRFKDKLFILHYEENPLVPGMLGCDWVEVIPQTATLIKK